MDIEEWLRARFAAAGRSLPGAPLDYERTMEVARHLLMRHLRRTGGRLVAGAALAVALAQLWSNRP